VEEAVTHLLYPKEHPYYADVIGSHADIQAAQLKDVKTFFKQYYIPNNASIAIVGDINKADAVKLAEKYFGSFKKGCRRSARKGNDSSDHGREASCREGPHRNAARLHGVDSSCNLFGRRCRCGYHCDLLGGDKVSRLYKSLVYEKQIAQDVSAFNSSYSLGSVFLIQATAAPNHTLEEIERAIDVELETLRTKAACSVGACRREAHYRAKHYVFSRAQRRFRRHCRSHQTLTTTT